MGEIVRNKAIERFEKHFGYCSKGNGKSLNDFEPQSYMN